MDGVCFPTSALLLRLVEGQWVASNPLTREHVALDAAAIGALSSHSAGIDAQGWGLALASASGWDCTGLAIEAGLWAEASGFAPQARPNLVGGEALFALLRKRHLLVANEAEVEDFLAPLASVLDRQHLGSFHQRVGQYLTLVKRQPEKWRWWHGQKFAEDGQSVRPGPYRDVQEHFFDNRFADGSMAGLRVLDFGCGNGFYSRKLEGLGAVVTGIDSSEELLRLAEAKAGPSSRFLHCASPADTMATLAGLERGCFDVVYLSDTFLLLSEDPTDLSSLAPLLDEFARLLEPGGRLILFEPNPVYWLAGYYGDPRHPYAVVTEHRNPVFGVSPPLDKVVGAMAASGFALIEYQHPTCREDESVDPALRGRAALFPLWDFMIFVLR